MKYEKSCGAVIFRNTSNKPELLLIKQVQGHWCFPKGHVEEGETELETASREILEETGLTVKFIDGFRHELSYSPSPGIHKDVIYFLAELTGGVPEVQEAEVAIMEWVNMDQVVERITYDNDKELALKAIDFINKTLYTSV